MKKIDINISKQPHFIGCWKLENDELCKDIINFFEKNKSKQSKGTFSGGYNPKEKKNYRYKSKPKRFR